MAYGPADLALLASRHPLGYRPTPREFLVAVGPSGEPSKPVELGEKP